MWHIEVYGGISLWKAELKIWLLENTGKSQTKLPEVGKELRTNLRQLVMRKVPQSNQSSMLRRNLCEEIWMWESIQFLTNSWDKALVAGGFKYWGARVASHAEAFQMHFSIFARSDLFTSTKLSLLTMSIDVGVESVHRGFGGAPVRSCWSILPAPVALGYPDSEEAWGPAAHF